MTMIKFESEIRDRNEYTYKFEAESAKAARQILRCAVYGDCEGAAKGRYEELTAHYEANKSWSSNDTEIEGLWGTNQGNLWDEDDEEEDDEGN